MSSRVRRSEMCSSFSSVHVLLALSGQLDVYTLVMEQPFTLPSVASGHSHELHLLYLPVELQLMSPFLSLIPIFKVLCFTQTSLSLSCLGGQPPQLSSQWTGPVTSCPSWPCWDPVQTGMWVCLLRICAPRSVGGPRRWFRTWSPGMQALTVGWRMRSVKHMEAMW